MSSHNRKILNNILKTWPKGTIAVQSWLSNFGAYRQLVDSYCRNSWLKRIGSGAYMRLDDKVDWTGGIYAIQTQL
ncbi:unnamed protein product, partial [marine sediment metagenome]